MRLGATDADSAPQSAVRSATEANVTSARPADLTEGESTWEEVEDEDPSAALLGAIFIYICIYIYIYV